MIVLLLSMAPAFAVSANTKINLQNQLNTLNQEQTKLRLEASALHAMAYTETSLHESIKKSQQAGVRYIDSLCALRNSLKIPDKRHRTHRRERHCHLQSYGLVTQLMERLAKVAERSRSPRRNAYHSANKEVRSKEVVELKNKSILLKYKAEYLVTKSYLHGDLRKMFELMDRNFKTYHQTHCHELDNKTPEFTIDIWGTNGSCDLTVYGFYLEQLGMISILAKRWNQEQKK